MYYFILGSIVLPITPSSIEISASNKDVQVDLIDGQEINITKMDGLKEFSFECSLPYLWDNALCTPIGGVHTVAYYLSELEKLKANGIKKIPFDFLIIRATPALIPMKQDSFKCTIAEIKQKEDAEEGFYLNLEITLKEYKDYQIKELTATTDSKGKVSYTYKEDGRTISTKGQDLVETNTVTADDKNDLWDLCKKYTGTGDVYSAMAQLNGLTDLALEVGQTVKVAVTEAKNAKRTVKSKVNAFKSFVGSN